MSQDQPGGRRSGQLVDDDRTRTRSRSGGPRTGSLTRPQPVLEISDDSGHLREVRPAPSTGGRSGWLLLLLPLIATLAAGAWFGRGYLSQTDSETLAASEASATPGAQDSAPAPSASPTASSGSTGGGAAGSADLGRISGRYVLKGPANAPAGTVVVYVVSGPKRGVHTSSAAPYDWSFDSRKIPNGTYTVGVTVISPDGEPVTQNHRMVVANAKQASTRTPAANTTTTKSSGSSGGSTGSSGSSGGTTGTTSGSGVLSAQATQVLSLTNAQRAKAGCKALTASSKLTKAAQQHSADMAQNNYFAHNSQDGTSPFTRIQQAGYQFRAAAENIAYGQQSAASVMDAWMHSPGHKANILNCTYTQIGIGYALRGGTPYWTQDFGTPL